MAYLVGNINFESVLMKIIPGTLIIGFFLLPAVTADSYNVSKDLFKESFSSVGVLLFILLSFVAGEVINFIRQKVYVAPKAFYSIIYHDTQSIKALPRHNQYYLICKRLFPWIFVKTEPNEPSHVFQYTSENFTEQFVTRFSDNPFYNPDVIYEILLTLLEETMSSDTRRRRSLYVFYFNTLIGAAISALLLGVQIIINGGSPPVFIGIISLVLFLIYLIASFSKIGEKYTQLLMIEAYLLMEK